MKKIIIGLDVSKEKLDATAIKGIFSENGIEQLDYCVFENSSKGYRSLLSWSKKLLPGVGSEDILLCCERTGNYDKDMCNYIYAHGYDIWRESALQIKLSSGVHKGKDDHADSLMIAEYAMRNFDKAIIYTPRDSRIEDLRKLLVYRASLVESKKQENVRMESMCTANDKSPAAKLLRRESRRNIERFNKGIKECENAIMDIIRENEDLKRTFNHIISVKSIGMINAIAFIVYTNNFTYFRTARQLASYYGVASFREKSGTSVNRRANVAFLSNHLLKSYISQAAECAVRTNGIYKDYYDRLDLKGKHYGIILNNVKNKLIHLVFSLVKNDCDFEYNHEFIRTWKNTQTA